MNEDMTTARMENLPVDIPTSNNRPCRGVGGEMIHLTDEETRRFAAWLRQDVESSRGVVTQLEKLPYASSIVAHRKHEMVACLIVAKMLEDT